MATVEILFKIGDAAGFPTDPVNSYKDGTVLKIMPEGYAWGPAAVTAYLDSGTPPPNWSSLANWEQEATKRRLDSVNYLTQPGRTPMEVADIREPGWELLVEEQAEILAEMQTMIDRAVVDRATWTTIGIDTNWGKRDLMTLGVALMALTDNQILRYYNDVEIAPTDTTLHPVAKLQNKAKKRWRLMYDTAVPEFDAAYLTALADPNVLVPVPRSMTPLLPGAALETN